MAVVLIQSKGCGPILPGVEEANDSGVVWVRKTLPHHDVASDVVILAYSCITMSDTDQSLPQDPDHDVARAEPIAIQPLLSGFVDADSAAEPIDEVVLLTADDQQALLERLEMAAMVLPSVKEERIMRKAVQAVHSYPINGEHNLATRRVINALIEHAQQVMRKFSSAELAAIRRFRISPRFTVSARRILELTELGANNYTRVYEALDKIYGWDIKWNLMGDGNENHASINDVRLLQKPLSITSKAAGRTSAEQEIVGERLDDADAEDRRDPSLRELKIVERVHSRLISQWSRGEGERQGLVSYEFPVDVIWMILEPKIYARIQMRAFNELGSAAAAALYENCARYYGSQSKVTPQLPVQEWINIIVGVGAYKGRLADFKRYVIEPSLQHIAAAQSCPFTVEPLWIKGPKNKVIALQFKLRPKQQLKLEMDMPLAWHANTIDMLKKVFGMSEHDIAEISRAADEAEIRKAISVYNGVAQRKAKMGEAIVDRAKYLRGIVRNLQEGRNKEEDLDKMDEPLEVGSTEARRAVDQMNELKERFEQHRRSRIIQTLCALPEGQYKRLQEAFVASLGDGNTVVHKFMNKGWTPPHPAVAAPFANWFMTQHPESAQEMLSRQEDRDFAFWLVMQSMQGKTSP